MSLATGAKERKDMLSVIRLGERADNMQEIDVGDETTYGSHYGLATVVVRMEGYETDYKPGLELVSKITHIPDLIAALQTVAACESLFDARTAAIEVLKDLEE